MNEMAYVLQAWLPLIVWQQVEAPEYQKGYITATALSAVLIVTAFVIRYLHKKQILAKEVASRAQEHESEEEGSDHSGVELLHGSGKADGHVSVDARDTKWLDG